MANFIQGSQLRTLNLGVQVVKTAVAFPQGATGTLATVSGGNVLVTSLYGQLTTGTGTVGTLALGLAPTVGTASTTSIATAGTVSSLEAGTFIAPPATPGGALQKGTNASTVLTAPGQFAAPAGGITWTTSGSSTGNITWYITYVPIDTGASVS